MSFTTRSFGGGMQASPLSAAAAQAVAGCCGLRTGSCRAVLSASGAAQPNASAASANATRCLKVCSWGVVVRGIDSVAAGHAFTARIRAALPAVRRAADALDAARHVDHADVVAHGLQSCGDGFQFR